MAKNNMTHIYEKENKNASRYYLVISAYGHKFRIYVEFTNGDPLGFNSKQSLSVLSSEGKWEYVVDSKSIGASERNCYESDYYVKNRARCNLVVAFKEYIEKVYG